MNKPNRLPKFFVRMAPALLVAAGIHAAQTDISTEPLNTYSAPSSTDVKPNVLFVLDDSGSMDWNYMPDQANDSQPDTFTSYTSINHYFKNNAFNGVAYNPGVRYKPPVYYNADGTLNTTTYPSMDGTSAAKGANMGSATPNWKAVPQDGYGVQSALTTTSDLTSSANAYVSVAGEYCTTPALLSCTTATAATGSYKYPAVLRWCDSAARTTCRATWDSTTYKYERMAAPRTATITITAASSAVISGITVSGQQIMTSSSSSSSTTTTVASNIASRINSCTNSISGNCTIAGYSASTGGTNVVTITGPIGSTVAPVVTIGSGSMTSTTTNFVQGSVPGENLRHTITSGINSYSYPGTSAKHANRTDCAGTTCTYIEEMTNYGNWYAYYRTRMQMMKSSASIAFGNIDTTTDIAANVSRFRVGYMSINNNTASDFLNLDEFKTTQKNAWFNKLFAANPSNSTPLREALSKAGRLYGGKLNGTTLNGSTVSDPLQYSCQQNYTILSTDGYWNGNGGKKLDGSTDMDNQDTPLPAPYNDGGTANIQERTSSLQSQSSQLLASTSTLQTRTSAVMSSTSQLMSSTNQLQSSTATLQSSTATLQASTAQLQSRTSSLQGTKDKVLMRCSNTAAACGSAPATGVANGTWSVVTSGTCVATSANQCQTVSGIGGAAVTVATRCNTSAAVSQGNGSIDITVSGVSVATRLSSIRIDGTEILTATTGSSTNNTNSRVAARIQEKVGNGYSATVSGATVTVTKSGITNASTLSSYTVSSGGATLTGSNATVTYTLSNADSNGLIYSSCSYSSWSAWADATSCTYTNQSSTPNNTTVTTATQCGYPAGWGTASAAGSCTYKNMTTATTDGTVYQAAPKQCSYTAWTTPADAGSCTYVNKTTATTDNTVYQASPKQCSYTAWTTPANAGSCTYQNKTTATTDNTVYQASPKQCSYAGWTTAAAAGSCTYNSTVTSATTDGTVYNASPTICSYGTWSTAALAGSCTASAQTTSTTAGTVYNASPVACSYDSWSAWADATATCTTVAQSTSGTYNATARQCQYTTYTTPAYVGSGGSCTTVAQSSASPYSVLLARSCSYSSYSTWANATSCTTAAKSTSSPYTVDTAVNCQYSPSTWSGWSTVASCTAAPKSTSSPYTVATARECQTLTSGGTSNTLADVAAYYYGKDLRDSSATGADTTGTCTGPTIPPATSANDLCTNNVPQNGTDVATTQHMTTFTLGLGAQGRMVYSSSYASDASGDYYDIRSGTTASPSTGICSWQTAGSTCTWPVPSSDSIANIDDLWHTAVNGRGTYYSAKDPDSLATGLANTLSAISNTPRAGTAAAAASSNPNVSSSDNYVFSSYYRSVEWWGEMVRRQLDTNGNLTPEQWSAMTLLDCGATPWQASKSYKTGQAFRNGTTCYKVTADYVSSSSFGATDTANATVVYGAQDWVGSSHYAQGSVFRRGSDCYLVSADYTSDTTFGSTDTTNAAITVTDTRCSTVTPQTTRTIYTKGTTATSLMAFTWANLLSAGLDSYFIAPTLTYASSTSGLSQFCTTGDCLSSSQQSNTTIATGGAAGEALVEFLRGDRTYEGSYFRERLHVLGDIVASEGRHVKAPLFSYYDDNYTAFKTAMASRAGTVYVSANDGMLHAFDAETGQERWAYVPRSVLPNLYKLADKNYSTKHQFYVDASPETGDICPTAPSATCTSSQWKTIIVGGLNRGGKGYFALDITNPSSPALLWEIDNTTTGFANLGYSYGNPRITKLHDGTWVVLFTSGYNNADGNGYLYVVNANSGALIRTIATGVGSATTPSGLARIAAHSTTATTDNTVTAVYGGDLLGNVWRFDVNDQIGTSGYEAHRLVTLVDGSGTAQPITEKPLVATIDSKTVVFVGTGRFLGTTDVSATQTQSFYAIKDNYDTATWGNPRTLANGFVSQTLTSGSCPSGAPSSVCSPGQSIRLTTDNEVDWSINSGWYFDLIGSGERSTTDPALVQGTLLFTTIAPSAASANACSSDSTDSSASFVYAVDYRTGGMLANTQRVAGRSLGNVLATRPVVVKLADGSVRALIRTSGGSAAGDVVMTPTVQSLTTSTRRVSWRELVSDQ